MHTYNFRQTKNKKIVTVSPYSEHWKEARENLPFLTHDSLQNKGDDISSTYAIKSEVISASPGRIDFSISPLSRDQETGGVDVGNLVHICRQKTPEPASDILTSTFSVFEVLKNYEISLTSVW
jgi:hypothetical protein